MRGGTLDAGGHHQAKGLTAYGVLAQGKRTAMRTMLIIAVLAFASPATFAAAPDNQPYHVMWTMNGKQKCCNKNSQEKADRHADKLRAKGRATNVQVMAGKCSAM